MRVSWGGGCLDFVVRETFFQDINGEAIKTSRAPNAGTQRALIERCIFQGTWRDGIDTTGGFKDSVVRDCILRRNDVGGVGGGIDIKTVIEPKTADTDMHPDLMNKNIRIERCQFIDVPNAIVITAVDRANRPTVENVKQWVPHEIYIDDCTFERTRDWPNITRAILLKGGHTIRWNNAQRRGDVVFFGTMMPRKDSRGTYGESTMAALATVNFDVGGTELPVAEPQPYNEDVPFPHGPQRALPPRKPVTPASGP